MRIGARFGAEAGSPIMVGIFLRIHNSEFKSLLERIWELSSYSEHTSDTCIFLGSLACRTVVGRRG